MSNDLFGIILGVIVTWVGILIKGVVDSSLKYKDKENNLLINESIDVLYRWLVAIAKMSHNYSEDAGSFFTYKHEMPPIMEAGTLDDFISTSFVDLITSMDAKLRRIATSVPSNEDILSMGDEARSLARELRWYKIRLESRLTYGALSQWMMAFNARRAGLRSIQSR